MSGAKITEIKYGIAVKNVYRLNFFDDPSIPAPIGSVRRVSSDSACTRPGPGGACWNSRLKGRRRRRELSMSPAMSTHASLAFVTA